MRSALSVLSKAKTREFRKLLLRWFDRNKRELPWRGERDPYRILVSEIMLQQTRVAVVEGRYKQFLVQFPTLGRLARAREQRVLASWSGLGYYRRARSLHAAAKQIAREGSFPTTAGDLRELPGVGRYTASAVASIAFGEPVPVVDGNVKRVLGRVLARSQSDDRCWQAADDLLDRRRPGDFNQALMELGALVCLPGRPLCEKCPVATLCAARGTTSRPKASSRRKAGLNYAFIRRNGSVLLRQRDQSASLMPGMWELPLLEPDEVSGRVPVFTLRHSITSTDYSVQIFTADGLPSRGHWVRLRTVDKLPLTGLTRKILHRLKREPSLLVTQTDDGIQIRR
jgi:A/G-specific adenine glycosylase